MQKNTSFRQCPLCDLKNCYRLLQFSSFALRKRATHLIWFKFFLTDSPCFLSVNISSTNPFYYFYIHTHFVEPLQCSFSVQYTLKRSIKTLRIITNKTLKRIKKDMLKLSAKRTPTSIHWFCCIEAKFIGKRVYNCLMFPRNSLSVKLTTTRRCF